MVPTDVGSLPEFAGASAHVEDKLVGVGAWFLEPAGVLFRMRPGTFVDGDVVLAMMDVKPKLGQRFAGGPYICIVDFTNAVGYNTHARQILTGWAQDDHDPMAKLVCIPPASSAVFRMGLSTIMAALTTAGRAMEINVDLEGVIAQYGLALAR